MPARRAFVHEARLALAAGTDTRAPGGAVTTALCGHWEHEGPCRWPHNNEIAVIGETAVFRTVFVAPPDDEEEVRRAIETALRAPGGWTVVSAGARPLAEDENALARRLGSAA